MFDLKQICPNCDAENREIGKAWQRGEGCPYCGEPDPFIAWNAALAEFVKARLAEDRVLAQAALDDLYGEDDCFFDTSNEHICDHYLRHRPSRVLREVQAKRAIIERESTVDLPEWRPDCGGDWILSGPGFFANYWPDNTVSASITDGFDGPTLADSGIVPKESRAACQAFAENWIRKHLPERNPILRALAAVWSDHEDYQPEWALDPT